MRKRTLLLSIAVACILAAATFGWVTIRRGFSARDNPSAIETLIATIARQLAVPSQYRPLRNPLSSSSDLHAGMEHFANHCATMPRQRWNANKTDIKVTQELLRHASSRVTLDTYTQAVTIQKRRAQSSVIRLLQAPTTAAG